MHGIVVLRPRNSCTLDILFRDNFFGGTTFPDRRPVFRQEKWTLHAFLVKENCLLSCFWSKSPIKFFGAELFDMGRSCYWKRQYFFVRPLLSSIALSLSLFLHVLLFSLCGWTSDSAGSEQTLQQEVNRHRYRKQGALHHPVKILLKLWRDIVIEHLSVELLWAHLCYKHGELICLLLVPVATSCGREILDYPSSVRQLAVCIPWITSVPSQVCTVAGPLKHLA